MTNRLSKTRRQLLMICLVGTATVGILASLLVPSPQWASSGSITIPVEVMVFDTVLVTPIENAIVTIVRAPPRANAFNFGGWRA